MVFRKVLDKITVDFKDITDEDVKQCIFDEVYTFVKNEYECYIKTYVNIDEVVNSIISKYQFEIFDKYNIKFEIETDINYFNLKFTSNFSNEIYTDRLVFNNTSSNMATIYISAKYDSGDTFDYVIERISLGNGDKIDMSKDLFNTIEDQYDIIYNISNVNWYKLFGEYTSLINDIYYMVQEKNIDLNKISKMTYEDYYQNYIKDKHIELLVDSNRDIPYYELYRVIKDN